MNYIVLILLLFTFQVSAEEKVLHIYNWAEYMTEEVIDQFQKETGIQIKLDYFGTNEELVAKLQAGAFDYDIAVPSDYYIKILTAQHLIQPLDVKLLPNRKHLDERFMNAAYDPGNRYSVPYFWGTTGIGYDTNHVREPAKSWKDLFDPKYKRKINVLDDMREVIGAALRLQGVSINTRDPKALEVARKFLLQKKDIIRTFNSTTYKESVDAGDIWISQSFSVDIIRLADDKPNVRYIIPEDGATLFTDNLVIPVKSKRVKEAHQLIDFLLRPEISAKQAIALRVATPNREAMKLLPPEVRNNPAAYPPPEVLKRLEFVEDVGEALPLYESIWFDVKTH
jgi:spermidine/putrescine-binding protein